MGKRDRNDVVDDMAAIKYDPTVNLGTIATIAVILVGMVGAWSNLSNRSANNLALVAQARERISTVEAMTESRTRELADRIRALEINASAQAQFLESIELFSTDIRRQLAEIQAMLIAAAEQRGRTGGP